MISERTIGAIRFGYGPAGKGDTTAAALLAGLPGGNAIGRRFPLPSQGQVFERLRLLRDGKKGAASAGDVRRAGLELKAMQRSSLLASVARIVESQTPLFERLAWFWADHFTVALGRGPTRPLGGAFVDEAIRPFVVGRFADMLTVATTHPAMLDYLDQYASVGPNSKGDTRRGRGLNENLAREVLELHTLGVGAKYDQGDVRRFAELLTGLTYDIDSGTVFRPDLAEPGPETVLGKVYGDGGPARYQYILEALQDLAAHPATARHIAVKLARHFVSDAPDDDLVASLEGAYNRSGGQLMPVYEALLRHPAAWRPPGGKIRQPLDYAAAALIAVGLTGAEVNDFGVQQHNLVLLLPLQGMGQPFMEAPGPNGWPEEAEYWITSQGLAKRIGFAASIARRYGDRVGDAGRFLNRSLADAAGAPLREAVRDAGRKADGVTLVLASAEMNRR